MAKLDRSERIMISVIQGVIKNYGSKFSLNSIAKEMEISSHVTVRDYLELLDELYGEVMIIPVSIFLATL